MRVFLTLTFFIFLSASFAYVFTVRDLESENSDSSLLSSVFESAEEKVEREQQEKFMTEFQGIELGKNGDFLNAARDQIGVVTEYDTSYYSNGGYPPEDKGACSDVLWRAFEDLGIDDFKKSLDADMRSNPSLYPSDYDSNINFRRVRNILVFLNRKAKSLTTEIIPGNVENLKQWRGGDIVTFAQIPGGLWHVAVVSDKRRKDGVPYLVHNYGVGVQERLTPLDWPTEVTGHYRWKF